MSEEKKNPEENKAPAKAKTAKKGTKKVKALVDNLAGKYHLPWNKGQKFELPADQADELIEAGDAKEVK